MADERTHQSVFLNTVHAFSARCRELCAHIGRKSLIWIVLSIIAFILIALAIILPTTILLTKKVDSSTTATSTTATNTMTRETTTNTMTRETTTNTMTRETTITTTNTMTTETTITTANVTEEDQCLTYSTLASFDSLCPNLPKMLVTDFNADGKLDIILVLCPANEIHIWLNSGNGTFTNQKLFSSNTPILSVQTADMNNDNQDDPIISYQTRILIVFVENINISLYAVEILIENGFRILNCIILDANIDTKLDIILQYDSQNDKNIFFNEGNGKFMNQPLYIRDFDIFPNFILTGDLNNDNMTDILARIFDSSFLIVFVNNGNGNFTEQMTNIEVRFILHMGLYDLNGDNKIDVVTSTHEEINVYFNLGNTVFDDPLIYPSSRTRNSLEMADVNNDDKIDIIVADASEDKIEIYFNTGNSTFYNRSLLLNIIKPRYATAFDTNGDGKNEIVIIDDSTIRALSIGC